MIGGPNVLSNHSSYKHTIVKMFYVDILYYIQIWAEIKEVFFIISFF